MYQFDRSSRKRLEGVDHVDGQVGVVGRLGLADQLVRAREQPGVERAKLDAGHALGQILVARLEALDRGVVEEEARRVPQRQQPPLDLVGRPVAEADVLRRRLLAVQPAHDVGAHALERLVGRDEVPPRAVHLAALGVEQLLVGQHLAERRAAGEHDRHEEQ